MDHSSLEKLLKIRYDLDMKQPLVIVDVVKSEDDDSKYYLITALLFENYKQEYLERRVFKLRY